MANLRTLAAVLCAVALAACGLQGAPVATAARIGAMVPGHDGHLAPFSVTAVDTTADLTDLSSSTRALSSTVVDDPGLDQRDSGLGKALRELQMFKRRLKKKKKGGRPKLPKCPKCIPVVSNSSMGKCRMGNKVKMCPVNSGAKSLARRDADAAADGSTFHQLLLWLIAKNGRSLPGPQADLQSGALGIGIPEASREEELEAVSDADSVAEVDISYVGSYIGSYAAGPMGYSDGVKDLALYPAAIPESDVTDSITPDSVHISPLMA